MPVTGPGGEVVGPGGGVEGPPAQPEETFACATIKDTESVVGVTLDRPAVRALARDGPGVHALASDSICPV